MKLFLTGMPGAGKTTIGNKLAAFLKMEFIDLDEEIKIKTDMSIPEIFHRKGEMYFRNLEKDLLFRFIDNKENFVMATGGGTPCFYDNLNKIRSSGITIFLDVEIEELEKRLQEDNERPLLENSKDLIEYLYRLREKRLKHYMQADIIIAKNDIALDDILRRVNVSN